MIDSYFFVIRDLQLLLSRDFNSGCPDIAMGELSLKKSEQNREKALSLVLMGVF